MPDRQQLTELQIAVLRLLWEQGELTVAQIWEHLYADRKLAQTTVAPRSWSQQIVESAARMRKSSVIRPSVIGTLKSVRTRTRRPSTGGRSSRSGSRFTPRARGRGGR